MPEAFSQSTDEMLNQIISRVCHRDAVCKGSSFRHAAMFGVAMFVLRQTYCLVIQTIALQPCRPASSCQLVQTGCAPAGWSNCGALPPRQACIWLQYALWAGHQHQMPPADAAADCPDSCSEVLGHQPSPHAHLAAPPLCPCWCQLLRQQHPAELGVQRQRLLGHLARLPAAAAWPCAACPSLW